MANAPASPIILVVLDGFGLNPKKEGNAIALAHCPTIRAFEKGNHSAILASGEAVGLPDGQMGNSEVGHTNIGSGRVVYQDYVRINKASEDRSFFDNHTLQTLLESVKKKKSKLHLMGLVSDGGIHSHIRHLFALLAAAKRQQVEDVYIHCFLDGRDTPYNSSPIFIEKLESFLAQEGIGKIASVSGRFYAMDRDKRWDRVQKTYETLAEGKGRSSASALSAIQEAADRGETDEFVQPTIVCKKGTMDDEDTVIFFNFRADRARQLTHAFTENDFSDFLRTKTPQLSAFATMTKYHQSFTLPVLFPRPRLTHVLGEVLSRNHIPQLRIAETEKYAHVTFFFNGGEETVFEGEERILIPSHRDVATYDLKPEMSAPEITDTVIQQIKKKSFGFILVNFANADMVGHTGNLKATIQAIEVLDQCLGKIAAAIQAEGGHLLITGDHGNAEQMIAPKTGKIHTAHTTNPVPFYYLPPHQRKVSLRNGILADFAPTILHVMGIDIPSEMTGSNLIIG